MEHVHVMAQRSESTHSNLDVAHGMLYLSNLFARRPRLSTKLDFSLVSGDAEGVELLAGFLSYRNCDITDIVSGP